MVTGTLEQQIDQQNETKRDAWIALVRELCDEVASWCEAERWFVDAHERTIREDGMGEYSVPELFIKAPGTRLTLEPSARDTVEAEGFVDIHAVPKFDRMILIRRGGKWMVRTDSGEPWPEPWGRECFLGVVCALAAP